MKKLRLFIMGKCLRRGLMWVAFLVVLAVAGTASASPVPISLSDFVIFSGGGLAINGGTEIGGHTHITGNIGSNEDLFLQGNPLPDYPAQLDGSAYAGGDLTFGQDLTVGSSSELREVVVNGAAAIGGDVTIWGTLDAASYTLGTGAVVTAGATAPSSKTFGIITMPAATVFSAGGTSQTVPAADDFLTLAPGTYGALSTSKQYQKVTLSSGNYYFDSIYAQGTFTLEIDLTSGDPINIYIVGDATFVQNSTLMVKGAGTGGAFVDINSTNSSRALAGLIYFETHGRFVMGGGNTWGGTVYASLEDEASAEVQIGQYMDWTGAVWAFDSLDFADHGTWNYVPLAVVPVPSAILLLGSGLIGLVAIRRKKRAQG